jgi:hypothetical protein
VHVTYKSPKRSVAPTRTRHGHLLTSSHPHAAPDLLQDGALAARKHFELAVNGSCREDRARPGNPPRAREESGVTARRRAEGEVLVLRCPDDAPAARTSPFSKPGAMILFQSDGSMLGLRVSGGTGGLARSSDPLGTSTGGQSITISAGAMQLACTLPCCRSDRAGSKI